MKLTRYGYDVILVVAVIVVVLVVVALVVKLGWIKVLLFTLAGLLAAFTLYFFRDPDRTLPPEAASDSVIISPADGKVVVITDVQDNEYHHGPAKQISIFLSPLNVHVNRIPVSGVIDYYRYVEGKYLVAFNDKASELNERTHVGVKTASGVRILFKQIAGAVARRIVCELKVGDSVHVGDRYGMIKFGSRMDLLIPPEMIVNVTMGQTVVGGETILCRMP